jgi:hypothetical protein
MVVEAGHHYLPNGMEYDAGSFLASDANPFSVEYHAGFEGEDTPVVFTQVTTSEGDHAIEARHFNADTTSFQVRMQNEEE